MKNVLFLGALLCLYLTISPSKVECQKAEIESFSNTDTPQLKLSETGENNFTRLSFANTKRDSSFLLNSRFGPDDVTFNLNLIHGSPSFSSVNYLKINATTKLNEMLGDLRITNSTNSAARFEALAEGEGYSGLFLENEQSMVGSAGMFLDVSSTLQDFLRIGVGNTPWDDNTTLVISASNNINKRGHIGIGGLPHAKHQLVVKSNSTGTNGTLAIIENSTTDYARLFFLDSTEINKYVIKARPDHTDDKEFVISYNGVNKLVVQGDLDRVGINKGSPQANLHIKQEAGTNSANRGLRLEADDGTHWTILTDNQDNLSFWFDGTFQAKIEDGGGSFTITSDLRLKENIEILEPVLAKINALTPKRYNYIVDKKKRPKIGFIAQEVEKLFPELVKPMGEYKGLVYDDFAILAIKGIQEQQKIIDTQSNEIKNLIVRMKKMEDQINN